MCPQDGQICQSKNYRSGTLQVHGREGGREGRAREGGMEGGGWEGGGGTEGGRDEGREGVHQLRLRGRNLTMTTLVILPNIYCRLCHLTTVTATSGPATNNHRGEGEGATHVRLCTDKAGEGGEGFLKILTSAQTRGTKATPKLAHHVVNRR